jgi:hypothetical protein
MNFQPWDSSMTSRGEKPQRSGFSDEEQASVVLYITMNFSGLSVNLFDTRCNLLGPVEIMGCGLGPHGIILCSFEIRFFVPV